MILTVPFSITVKVTDLEKNYSGKITLSPANLKPQAFYFLVLNPYGGADAEFSIFEDKEMTVPLVEAVGESVTGYNPHTGRPITNYDFGIQQDSPKIGLVTVAAMIISEAIYCSEVRYREGGHADKAEGPSFDFTHVWQQDFTGKTFGVAESFLRAFELS